jgi:hypothetical protein
VGSKKSVPVSKYKRDVQAHTHATEILNDEKLLDMEQMTAQDGSSDFAFGP